MKEISTKTQTEVVMSNGIISVNCFFDVNANNNTNPSIYKSDVLSEEKEINAVSGVEGDLIISNDPEKSFAELDSDGNLEITVVDDLATNYQINDENLEYNG